MKKRTPLFLIALLPLVSHAEIITRKIKYWDGKTELEGRIAYDNRYAIKKPGILVFHDWMGTSSFTQQKAEDLARLGYVGFEADLYGEDLRPENTKEAAAVAESFKNNRALLRRRARLALETLEHQTRVEKTQIGAIGFCFGGTAALELARSGAPVEGVVSFHGGLSTPNPDDAKKILGKILVLHGAEDPWVPPEEVAAFEREMTDAGVDWELVKYSNAVHAFTNPAAGNDNSKGAAYNREAAERSWETMKDFFNKLFGKIDVPERSSLKR